MIRLPVAEPAGERDQVDARVLAERRAGVGSGAEHEVADAGRQAGLRRAAPSGGSRWAA